MNLKESVIKAKLRLLRIKLAEIEGGDTVSYHVTGELGIVMQ
jgi:hypothetical protein